MYYACTDKLGVVGLCKACLCCCIEAKLGCFRHGRPGGEGSGLAAGFVGKVLVWLGGKGYGQGYRVIGLWLCLWSGLVGMVMVWLRG